MPTSSDSYKPEIRTRDGRKRKVKHSLKCIGVLRGLGLILGIIISLSILVGFVLIINKIKTELHTDYMSAQDAIKAGDYQQAMDIFDMLGPNYQETQKYKEYTRAIMLYNDKKFKEAETVFKSLGNFEETSGYLLKIQDEEVEDSRERLYTEACKYYAENNYAKASDIFSSLGDYENSQSLVERSKTLWRQQYSNIISAGIRCSVGITDSGGVKLSCEDFFFGRNDIEQKWSEVISVSACGEFVLGLKEDGSVLFATMERGDSYDYPVSTDGWADIIAVSAGEQFIVGLKSDGTIVSSGSPGYGEADLSNWEKIVAIDTGWQHVVGLDQDGNVHIAGKHVEELQNDIDEAKDEWSDLIAISTGGSVGFKNGVRNKGRGHVVALRSDGKVVAVGDNEYGQCDVESWEDVVAISAGDYHTVGLTKDGRILSTQRESDFPDSYQKINNQWISKKFCTLSAGYGFTLGVETDGSVCNAGLDKDGQANVDEWKIKRFS